MNRLLTLTLAIGLVVAACASGEGDADTAASAPTASSTTEPSSDPTEPADDTTTTEVDATTTTAATAEGGGDDCLVGSWTLDSDDFVENFDEIMAQQGMPDTDVSALDGSFTVDMNADGTYVAIRDAWGFEMAMPDGTFVIEINGSETGTWSTNESILIINPQENDLTTTVYLDGEEMPLPGGETPFPTPEGLASNSEFDCSGDMLTMTNAGVESVLTRN